MSREEELKESILDVVTNCVKCRFCLAACPLFDITEGWHSQGAAGIISSLYTALMWGAEVEFKETLRNLLFSCTTCRNCVLACQETSVGVDLLDAIDKGRQLFIEEMIGPMPQQKKPLEFLERYKNPYGMLPSERKEWMKGLGVPDFSGVAEAEVLLHIGCTAAHDPRVANVARAVIQLLKKAQVTFGILEDEACCGCPALRLGEQLLSEDLAQENVNKFKSLGVKQIVTLSPHCFDTFINKYPKEEMQGIKVQHYSQLLRDLIKQSRLVFNSRVEKKVTYQDPCYLGRHNDIYEAPREVLNSIPGIELVEFRRCKAESLCCGGGGGRMWADFEAEGERLANIRVREAIDIGAEMIVTACPFCLINMEDGIKSVGVEDSLKVVDIAELAQDDVLCNAPNIY